MPILRLLRLNSPDNPLMQQAWEVYELSFPYCERRESTSQAAILSDPAYHFALLTEAEHAVGALLYWETADFTYLEHFFVYPEHRGRGLGSAALALLKKTATFPLILEVDPPEDELARRRVRFYERNGFLMTAHAHRQPPYHADTGGEPLRVLSYPHPISAGEYKNFLRYLTEHALCRTF